MKLLHNIRQLATCRADGGQGEIHPIADAGLVWDGDTIRWVGALRDLPDAYRAAEPVDAGGALVIPGLIDCHTHLVFGGTRHLALARPLLRGEAHPWPSPFSIAPVLAARGQSVAVLASGDPMLHGVGATLLRALPSEEALVLPAPSAFSLACARLGWALGDCACLTLHGRALARVVPHLQPGARLLVLSWDGTTAAAVAGLMTERGFGGSRITVCEAMGGPREALRTQAARDFDLGAIDALNTLGFTADELAAIDRHATEGGIDLWRSQSSIRPE